jgi:hypothetical protein
MHIIPANATTMDLSKKNGIFLKMEGNGSNSNSLYHLVIYQSPINS